MKNQTSTKILFKLFIVFIVFSSCKKSSDDDGSPSSDPCQGVTPVVATGLTAPEADTMRLFASTVTGASYKWTGPNGFSSTKQNPIVTQVLATANGTYKVTATVNGCKKESSVSLATFTYQTPPCVPDPDTYTIGSTSYNSTTNTIDYFNPNGIVLTITVTTASNRSFKMTFNSNDYNQTNQNTYDGVYKVNPDVPGRGHVQIVATEDVKVYTGLNGYVCVQSGVDIWGIPFTKYIWCGVKVERNGSVQEELSTSGFGYVL